MVSIHICGGYPLCGETRIQGSKNAVLPVLAATVLVNGISTLYNCPKIADVQCMIKLLESTGCRVTWKGDTITVDACHISSTSLPGEYVSRMRSSVILMGALLGREGQVSISYPGGCVIGKRPIDMHLEAFARMGVALTETCGVLTARAQTLTGGSIPLAFPSVGATENVILAAALAGGETVICGGAQEPEIGALCEFLIRAGADICRDGDGTVVVRGVPALHTVTYRIPPDRIVAGTYLMGCMAAGGQIFLRGADGGQLGAALTVIRQMGGVCTCCPEGIGLVMEGRPAAVACLKTAVYPGFPTDLQSQLLAALTVAKGESVIEETVFENRFRVVPELVRMGAQMKTEGNRVRICGVERLHGACVTAQELRGGAALCMAALAAHGDSRICNRHFIDRGYASLEADIRSLGGRI